MVGASPWEVCAGPPDEVSLDRLRDASWLEARIAAAGLASEARDPVLRGIEAAANALRRDGVAPGTPAMAHFVPGRVELLGKHTDYAGGRSLLVASEPGISVVSVRDARGGVSVLDAREGATPYRESGVVRRRSWQVYPGTLTRRLRRDFPDVRGGVRVAFRSTIPPAAGMSSSSGLLVALFLALGTQWGLHEEEWGGAGSPLRAPGAGHGDVEGSPHPTRVALADYVAAIEAGRPFEVRRDAGGGDGGEKLLGGVGTEGGSQDHTAILCCGPARASRFGFRPTRYEGSVEVPPGWAFGVAVSGVRAPKAGAARDAYNRLAREAAALAEVWPREAGTNGEHLGALLEGGAQGMDAVRRTLRRAGGGAGELVPRLEQFAEETFELVPAAFDAFGRADAGALGEVVGRSHELAERKLRNQVPETTELVRLARELGAPAASAFGAGFGGAVWCLLPAGSGSEFLADWRAAYLDRFPSRAGAERFLTTGAAPPALRLS
ncbi:MAG: galactokinase family protein [Gemmatimonadota bacterium]